MNTVYLVTQGAYSDYSIVGVFTTREKADAFIAAYGEVRNSDPMGVEEYQLDQLADLTERGLFYYTVDLDPATGEGTVERVTWMGMKHEAKVYIQHFINGPRPRVRGIVLATSDEHALKIANEKRLVLLAQQDLEQ